MAVNVNDPHRYLLLAQQALQAQTTASILQSLNKANVPVIVLKGQALLGRVYPNISERQMGDIDLLLKCQDLVLAETLLQAEGYVFSDEAWGFNREFAREFGGEVPYRKGTIVIELHWHLLPLGWYRRLTYMDIAAVWTRAIPIEIGDAVALRLCPEDEVIHLCCHTAIQHSLIHPHGVRDILGVLRVERDALDWAVLAARAREWRVSVAVWAALKVARSRMQDAGIENRESRIENQESGIKNHESRGKKRASGNS